LVRSGVRDPSLGLQRYIAAAQKLAKAFRIAPASPAQAASAGPWGGQLLGFERVFLSNTA
jgi:hypothetical protein